VAESVKILVFSGQAGVPEILESGQKRGSAFQVAAKPIHSLKLLQQLKGL
jgi:hypothetical protein